MRKNGGPVVKEQAQTVGAAIFHLFESELDFVPGHRLTAACALDPTTRRHSHSFAGRSAPKPQSRAA